MDNKWHGIMKVLEISQIRNGEPLWTKRNINNTLHQDGEELFLSYLFGGASVPASYYLGLDNRTSFSETDTSSSLIAEPTGNGYARQPVDSAGFTIELVNNIYRATSAIVTFNATAGGWGPIQNIFLSDVSAGDGVLIASASLGQIVNVSPGDAILMRMALSLRDYPES